ncbi:MAG TPA: hypothetical protein VN626_02790, partial [Clostridia bacterium]|nr:hypothetical protein [Clostridia bacterium]
AEDCYALRCACLHQGEDNIEGQKIACKLDYFRFGNGPIPWQLVEENPGHLYLNTTYFCTNICDAAELWMQDVSHNEDIQKSLQSLIRFEDRPIKITIPRSAFDGRSVIVGPKIHMGIPLK